MKNNSKDDNDFSVDVENTNNMEHSRIVDCYNNIKRKVTAQRNISDFIETNDSIAFSGTDKTPELILTLTHVKRNGKLNLYADIDDEMSWHDWDYDNQDEFENAIVDELCHLMNHTIKTIRETKKHAYLRYARYYQNESNEWVLIDEDIINNFLIRLFIFRDCSKEEIKIYKLEKI